MNVLPNVMNRLLIHFWWIIPIAVIVGLLKVPAVKGYVGELVVRLMAHLFLDKTTYHRLHNVTVRTPDGTTQIDHVFVSRYGVFVLETKNMTGWIFGGEHQAQWTQQIYKQTFKFQNPLRQNYKHTKALEAALQVPAETIHSVVTFVGGSTFKTEMPSNVTNGAGFISYIKSFRTSVFTAEQVSALVLQLQSERLAPTFATHREHVLHLKQRSDPGAGRLCPKCGSALVLRTVKSGERAGHKFWGCSTYPKCRVIQEIR
jgi:restriction system protein